VPREVVFLDELPRNPTGKVLKRELEENGAGDDGSSGGGSGGAQAKQDRTNGSARSKSAGTAKRSRPART
jgi:hypothetical protein